MALSRRRFLGFLGAGAAVYAASSLVRPLVRARSRATLPFTPIRLPHPLPVYAEHESYLPASGMASIASGGGAEGAADGNAGVGVAAGRRFAPTHNPVLSDYEVFDDVVVPPEYERYVIAAWGDRPFPSPHDYVGYNHDYTGFVTLRPSPMFAAPSDGAYEDGLLWINHEHVSFPFHRLAPKTAPELRAPGVRESFPEVVGFALPEMKNRELMGEMLYNVGGSVLRIRRTDDDPRYKVVARDPHNRRIHGLSGLALNAQRTDGYARVVSWGARPHQKGDDFYLVATGPAARDVFVRRNGDGLGNKIIGTNSNCAGATTPWGTILSAEENFNHRLQTDGYLGVTEDVRPDGTQTGYVAGTSGAEFGLAGEKYGWLVEIDPRRPERRAKKHTALGRFQHENVALRVESGRPLVAYTSDDRHGGHVYKYVSKALVDRVASPRNSRLLEEGTLHVARFSPDGSGEWIALTMETATNPNSPAELSTVERARREDGQADFGAVVLLPRRTGIAGQTTSGGAVHLDLTNEQALIAGYKGKKLADFYESIGAVLCDGFLVSNLVGGTPSARPEEIEIHPHTREVYIAFTSGDANDDGYPDSRIFTVGKYTADPTAEQPHGGIYKLIESSADGAGTKFRWERFLQGGEVSADGAGFANADNLMFDADGTLWCCTDMNASRQYAPCPLSGSASAIRHDIAMSGASARELANVFGPNWLFVLPTSGPAAGTVLPFCYGPPGSELTGPTLLGDTLIVSVQHPGADALINDGTPASTITCDVEMLDARGRLVTQRRMSPRGSNWPSNIAGNLLGPPRPATIAIAPRRQPLTTSA